ncbi:MAG: AEC family transporter [Clostridia bacterium]|nr:AEC family transporter [Clostridia bacterium]
MELFLSNLFTAATNVAVLYIMVAVGFISDKVGIFTEETAKKVVTFLLYVVASCTLVNSFIKIDATPDTVSKFFTAFGLSVATHTIAILLNTLTFRNKKDERNPVYKFASIYGNVAFMALPLAQAVLGDEGVLYCAGGAVVFNLFTFTHGVKLMSRQGEKLDIKKIIVNPGVIAVVIGLPIFLSGIEVPYLISQPIESLAALNSPVAMLVFGTYLSRTDLKSMLFDKKIYLTAAMKLLVLPLICIGVYYLCGLRGAVLTASIITASVPSANNTFMFSSIYGRDAALASKTVALVSFLSIITMPVMIAITQLTW